MLKLKASVSMLLAATVLSGAMFSPVVLAGEVIKLATTTSTENSGLLGAILPKFEAESGYTVQVIATGTGKALKLASQGDVDVVMTHAPAAEAKFVADGFGIEPRGIMENDFIVLGPKNDPAAAKSSKDVAEAFGKIAHKPSKFVSRGDNSGTNMKELAIWKNAGVTTDFNGYTSVGQGMGKTLLMADELQAYTLTDRGTYIAYKAKLNLNISFEGGAALANPYQIMLINPAKYPDLNHKGAKALSDWFISPATQTMINEFTVQGEQLFKATYKK
ncbi:substrate-binding domain-containing protein [Shewanella saliphila]|uniref:Tungsten ABC transporter substrate-binding protein n=2 Tax=Shewanella saliphila TaxID=2282698 RepID=A0ABQ2Q3U4_9GAMM|nr:substrate-binding domain-containing protein [Shewanella saliphila]MCL1101229.1 substrate-binding domain-containing protein [Shewanella saliphila]GGP47967.1 tungsten ABC transporter substrate-binding protein [Shewanella saliphila]